MTDPEIKVGDVCIDLVERGKVMVVDRPYASVGEHQDHESYDIAEYKANALLDVKKAEGVYTCVYLPENPTTSFSGTYDFPRSRLARLPVEEAKESLQRPQREMLVDLLSGMFEAAIHADEGNPEARPDSFVQALRFCLPPSLSDVQAEAEELADVEARFGGDADA